jgi:hypothetical protein
MQKQGLRRQTMFGGKQQASPCVRQNVTQLAFAPFAATLMIIAIATSACAQTPDLDAARIQALEQELDAARQRALEAERAAYAAQTQARTEQTLNAMAAARDAQATAAGTPYDLPRLTPLPPGPTNPVAALDSQLAADGDRIMQLQAQALAGSNARILAVQPAL